MARAGASQAVANAMDADAKEAARYAASFAATAAGWQALYTARRKGRESYPRKWRPRS